MDPTTTLICEDAVHELVLFKILNDLGIDKNFLNSFIKRGKSYIDKNVKRYAQIRHQRIIVLRDLDNDYSCAPELKRNLLSNLHPGPDFIFRIAVREVEVWLLADKNRSLEFFKLNSNDLDGIIFENMVHPKRELLELIGKGRLSSVEKKQFFTKSANGSLRQSPTYNYEMKKFIVGWSIDRARKNSPSLHKAIIAIATSFCL